MTIPANYIIKNQNFDRISVCTHGFIVFLRQTDQAPLNIPYGFDSYNYYLNFLDDSTDQLDTTQILVTANKIIVSGFRLNADTAYKSRAIIDFKGNFINKIAVEVDKADTGLITIIHMFGHKLSKIDQEQKYWDDAILLCQLFNYEQACQYTVYTLTEAIEIDTNITNTIPAGGIDSMLVQINFLKLKQEQPSRTFRSYYAGGFYLYRTDDPNNPVGQFKVIVTNDGGYNVSTSESKKNISKVPFVYKNGKIVLIEKGQYRIYSIDGKIVGVINSNGNFTLKHLKPGVYIIKYNNQSFSAIVMKFDEISSGFIVFYIENNKIYYLLLKHKTYWGFAKGKIEENEDELNSAIRELYEETSIKDIEIYKDFRKEIYYNYYLENRLIRKKLILFLARAKSKKFCISDEHSAGGWFEFKDALNLVRYENNKRVLIEANEYIINVILNLKSQ
ncbi:MAG: NUDIX domain-containing protein [candidate division WOR-3 bacterium]